MKILVRRTGGFAGISETLYDVDTSTLDASAAAELERKVRQLESEASSEGAAAKPVGADLFKYEISLTDQLGQRTITVPDDGSHVALLTHELVDGLSAVAPR
jgi:hypothetical protein